MYVKYIKKNCVSKHIWFAKNNKLNIILKMHQSIYNEMELKSWPINSRSRVCSELSIADLHIFINHQYKYILNTLFNQDIPDTVPHKPIKIDDSPFPYSKGHPINHTININRNLIEIECVFVFSNWIDTIFDVVARHRRRRRRC